MDAAAGLSFGSITPLYALALIPFAAIFLVRRESLRRMRAESFVSERLRGSSNTLRGARPWLVSSAFLLAVIALAGPRLGFTTVEVPRNEANRVIALDVSKSMAAQDVGTSRLEAAKAVARKIVLAHSGRVGLIVFEKTAEAVSPLTTDVDAVATLIDSIEAGELSQPGSDLSVAIEGALALAETAGNQKVEVVLLSDGEDQGKGLDDAVRKAAMRNVRVSTITIGTGSGATIPTENGAQLHDDNGDVVKTIARNDVMESVARRTGGRSYTNPFAEHSLDALVSEAGEGSGSGKVLQPIERFQWPLAMSFLLFFLGSLAHRGAE